MTSTGDARPVALITGGARGIGFATVSCLAARGWRVVAADLQAGDSDQPSLPERATFLQVDVSDTASVNALIASVAQSHARLDALVNCAGISRHQLVAELADDTWRTLLDVHIGGTLRCCRAALPMLRATGRGAVVNFSSVAAHLGRPRRAPYSAAKAGIEGITRTLAIEWAADNIRVNAVAPGWIKTRLVQNQLDTGLSSVENILSHIPLARMGEPDEIATTVAFLLSRDASYITGQTVVIDGGATISGNW